VGGRRRWHQGANVATKAGGGATTAGGTSGGVQAGGRVIFLLWFFLPPLHPRGARACVLDVYVQRVRVEVNREVGVCLLTRRGGFLDCCSPVAVWRLFLLLSAAALFSPAPPLLPLRAFTLDPAQSLLERCVAAWMRRRCSGLVPFVGPWDDSKKCQGLSCKKTATRPIQPVHGLDPTAGSCARRGHAPWSRY
jgi:hypothetical protein